MYRDQNPFCCKCQNLKNKDFIFTHFSSCNLQSKVYTESTIMFNIASNHINIGCFSYCEISNFDS